jgi:hypothetical protein
LSSLKVFLFLHAEFSTFNRELSFEAELITQLHKGFKSILSFVEELQDADVENAAKDVVAELKVLDKSGKI